jgi:hypothetical protein
MQLARPLLAMDPKRFGKGRVRDLADPRETGSCFSADVKLFATTFLAGFVFVSILIA